MTGRCPIRAGVATNGLPLRPTEKSLAAQLKSVGYETALIGKWHLGSTPETVPNAHGFDYYYGFHEGCVDYYSHRYYWGEPARANFHDLWRNRDEIFEDGQYLTERLGDEASAFIARPRRAAIFLYSAFNAVHYPMHAPRKYVSVFLTCQGSANITRPCYPQPTTLSAGRWKRWSAPGKMADTVIYLLGDNGATTERRGTQPANRDRWKNGSSCGYKFSTFDGGTHVPGPYTGPVRYQPEKYPELVMTADIFLSSSCGLTGAQLPSDRTFDGRDMWPVVTQAAPSGTNILRGLKGRNSQSAGESGSWC